MNQEKYQKMLELIQKYHAGQMREGGVMPYWPHCERTAVLLRRAFESNQEGSTYQQEESILAALGHDLYEDTAITHYEIVDEFGAVVDSLIEEVTNRFGDDHVARYAEKLRSVSELALLIKLADLCDNYGSGHMALSENGYKWTKEFLWPTLEAQWAVVKDINFRQFPKTAGFLIQAVAVNREILEQALKDGEQNKVA